MVTCRELIDELSRIFITFFSWVYALPLALYLVARLAAGDGPWALAMLNNFVFYLFLPLLLLVPLGFITRAKWGLLLTMPLAVIGLVWFAPYFLQKNPAPSAGPTLKVVTLNAYRGNQTLAGTVENWLLSTDADLIFIQEFPLYTDLPLLYRFDQIYPYKSIRWKSDASWGNALLSRFPILETEELNAQHDRAPYSQQRYLLDIDGLKIAAYNVDLILPFGQPRFMLPFVGDTISSYLTGYNDDLRDAELWGVLNRIDQEEHPFIAAGDFNTSEHAVIYEELAARMRDSFREVGRGLGTTWPIGDVEELLPPFVPPLLRVDYIWHSDDFRAVEAWRGPKVGSDHLPVYAELEVLAAPSG